MEIVQKFIQNNNLQDFEDQRRNFSCSGLDTRIQIMYHTLMIKRIKAGRFPR